MKDNILTGAYGWQHEHWNNSFYPGDLPNDWQLDYYSNAFDCVLVPPGDWMNAESDEWQDSVHAGFRFYLELGGQMDVVKIRSLRESLGEQLAGVLSMEATSQTGRNAGDELKSIIPVYVPVAAAATTQTYRYCDKVVGILQDSCEQLRESRVAVEQLVQSGNLESVIVNHDQLDTENLSRFRQMLELMGL